MSIFTSIFNDVIFYLTVKFLAVLSTKKIGGFLLAVLINENLLKLLYCLALFVAAFRNPERFYILSLLSEYYFYDY